MDLLMDLAAGQGVRRQSWRPCAVIARTVDPIQPTHFKLEVAAERCRTIRARRDGQRDSQHSAGNGSGSRRRPAAGQPPLSGRSLAGAGAAGAGAAAGARGRPAARRPTGAKYSIGTLDIAVLHAPEACRVQAVPGDTVPTPANKQRHKTPPNNTTSERKT